MKRMLIYMLTFFLILSNSLTSLMATENIRPMNDEIESIDDHSIIYWTKINDTWNDAMYNGTTSGNLIDSISGITVQLYDLENEGTVSYSIYSSNQGWINATNGDPLEAENISALKIELKGKINNVYDISYRIYTSVWSNWTYNGEIAGTTQGNENIKAIEVKLVEKVKINAAEHQQKGFSDIISSPHTGEVYVAGWAFDYGNLDAAIKIRVYIDDKMLGETTTTSTRNDLNEYYSITGKHGYKGSFMTEQRGTHQIKVVMVDLLDEKETVLATTDLVIKSDSIVDDILDQWIAKNTYAAMPDLEKAQEIINYCLTFDFDYDNDDLEQLLLTGKGECWAITRLITELAHKLGFYTGVRTRSNELEYPDFHINAYIVLNGESYYMDCGYRDRTKYRLNKTKGYSYRVKSNGTLCITDYDEYNEEIVIPSTIDGKKVSEIGANAFEYHFETRKVMIPSTVTKIDAEAFKQCTKLKDIEIPASVTSISSSAFSTEEKTILGDSELWIDQGIVKKNIIGMSGTTAETFAKNKGYSFSAEGKYYTTKQEPRGNIEIVKPRAKAKAYIGGWAYDGDDDSECIDIKVYVDNKYLTTFKADTIRDDVNAVFSIKGHHGISTYVTCPNVGVHKLDIYMVDLGTNKEYLLSSNTVEITCDHEYHETIIPASCDQAGKIVYECANCDASYEEELAALEHDYKVIEEKEATCMAEGYQVYECINCHDSYTVTLDLLQHELTVEMINEATCEKSGKQKEYCKYCDYQEIVIIEPLGHSYQLIDQKNADCEEGGYQIYRCKNCDDEYTKIYEKGQHEYRIDTNREPTCEQDGIIIEVCIHCDKTVTTVLQATGHEYELVDHCDPICETDGYDRYICSKCNDVQVNYIYMLQHNLNENRIEPTCTASGMITIACNQCTYKQETVIKALGHDYIEEVIEPTTEDQGYTLYTCIRCGDVYKDHFIDPIVKIQVKDLFSDVNEGAWYEEYVQYVYDHSIMSGYVGRDLFGVNDVLTREQMVQVLFNLEGRPEITDYVATSKFNDVSKGDWYEDAINWAYNNGITVGMGNGFGVGVELTRAQLVTFLMNYAKFSQKDVTIRANITEYVDYGVVSDWAVDNMSWAVGVGLISGVEMYGLKFLQADGLASRGQIAKVLTKYCEYYQV